jgi:hypothetical protein
MTASASIAAVREKAKLSSPRKRGSIEHLAEKQNMDSRSVTKMSGNDESVARDVRSFANEAPS